MTEPKLMLTEDCQVVWEVEPPEKITYVEFHRLYMELCQREAEKAENNDS